METIDRIHYMDNLRALAMLLGIFFHAALAYSPFLHELWFSADVEQSMVMDVFLWFSHLFRMPLFFLVAGFFACLMYEKRGLTGLLKNRALRVTLPFVLFLPILWIATFMIFGWALGNVENKSPLLNVIMAMSNDPQAQQQPPTTMHLWFLYYLSFFYLITALVMRLPKLTFKLSWLNRPLLLLTLLPWVLVPALLMVAKPYPAPEQFIPKIWACWYFGCFFALGWLCFRRDAVMDLFKPYAPWLFVISLAAYSVYFYLLPEPLSLEMAMTQGDKLPALTPVHFMMSILEAYISVYLVLVCLVWGKRFLHRKSPAVRLIADSSYWIYLVHIPLLFFIQFALLDTDWPLIVEFAISCATTLAIGFLSYLAFVRWTPIGWLLNGRKRWSQPALTQTTPNNESLSQT